jgi:hypothetical protein
VAVSLHTVSRDIGVKLMCHLKQRIAGTGDHGQRVQDRRLDPRSMAAVLSTSRREALFMRDA